MIQDLCLSFPQCTAFDLLEKGMEVHIVADAVSSRRYLRILFCIVITCIKYRFVPVCVCVCVCVCVRAHACMCACAKTVYVCVTTFVSPSTARRTVCLLCPDWSRAELTSTPQRVFCCSWFRTLNTPTSRRCLLQLLSVSPHWSGFHGCGGHKSS